MSLSVQIGLLLAVATAFFAVVGFLYKHRGAAASPPVEWRRPVRTSLALFRNRWYVLGIVVAIGSWGFHVAALALAGIAVLSMSALVVIWRRRVSTQTASFDRAWLDFRNAFGALWGLRVAARFNQSAQQLHWTVRLGWHGLEAAVTAPNPPSDLTGEHHAMEQVLGSLLRRFVDDDSWRSRRESPLAEGL